ncbi:MAG: primosomal protein N' [Flavobacteriales bacterium]|nr:MAG: primosomal protein N' [Flavobacteriales bacterium]
MNRTPQSQQEQLFAEVVLPLPFAGALTYSVPADLASKVATGHRLVVPFGKGEGRLLTGVVLRTHQQAPVGHRPRAALAAPDDTPLVLSGQLKHWFDLADYYMCSLGEVMMAAIPSVFMISSETRITTTGRQPNELALSNHALRALDMLGQQPLTTLDALRDSLGPALAAAAVNELVLAGAATVDEELKDRSAKRTEHYLERGARAAEESTLHEWFTVLEKKGLDAQLRALMKFVELSACFTPRERPVRRGELQRSSGTDATIVKQLVGKGVLRLVEKEPEETVKGQALEPRLAFSGTQQKALNDLRAALREHPVSLLHGVTASGKTELYVELMAEAIAKGGQVLYLLPEIALTTQIIGRLKKHFGERVAVYHSRLSMTERAAIWRRMVDSPDQVPIVLGARSAVFLPFHNLQLVVVDEEHEPSYKQQDPAPRYHARETAIMLAHNSGGRVVLGSATPSMESLFNAKNGKYGFAALLERFGDAPLPTIKVVDLAEARRKHQLRGSFSVDLCEAIEASTKAREQTILFQNRRGYVPLWQCETCDWTPQCERCDVSLTYHKRRHRLSCHYCGREYEPPTACAKCGSRRLRMLGLGTEKVEEELALLFPEARIARMDQDTTRGKHTYHKLLRDLEEGAVDVLVGTQMVTKGLDFDHVNLVAVVSADALLKFPDLRAHERAFQLMAQVAGRAGRRNRSGLVMLQTFDPGHPVLGFVKNHDVLGFYERELEQRRKHHYPPFSRLVRMTLKHAKEDRVASTAAALMEALRPVFGEMVIGPEVPAVAWVRNLHLRNIMVKLGRGSHKTGKDALRDAIDRVFADRKHSPVRITIDVDPM